MGLFDIFRRDKKNGELTEEERARLFPNAGENDEDEDEESEGGGDESKVEDEENFEGEQWENENMFGESYAFEAAVGGEIAEREIDKAGDFDVAEIFVGENGDSEVFAGPTPRHMFEKAGYKRDRPLWIGYDDTARGGFREGPIPFESLRRHLWVSGTTGAGKTTFLQNKAIQHTYGGWGFCNIDPKASGDTIELLQMIPEKRLDDVVFIEPASTEYERSVGINILDMPPTESGAEREKEVESRLDNLVALFSGGDRDIRAGARMLSILESMGRGMLQYNARVANDPERDSSEKFTILDMYAILLDEENRAMFMGDVQDPYIRKGLVELRKAEDEDVIPLIRRIKPWVENDIIRRIIATRDSTVDWDEIIDENKILLVRIPVDSADVHRMVTLTVIRNLWSAKKRQDRDPNRETKPYFLQLDEFEKIADDQLAMEDMLVRARSMWLSVCLGTQYPYQIQKDHPNVMRAVENNANTKLAMRTPGGQDAGKLMEGMGEDYDKNDLMNTNFFRCWSKLPLGRGEYTEPVNLKMFAPYPPLHSEEEITEEVIPERLEEHGDEPLDEEEILNQLKYPIEGIRGGVGSLPTVPGSSGGKIGPPEKTSAEDMPEELILEGVYAAQLKYTDEETLVPKEKAVEETEVRFGETGYDSIISNCFEKYGKIVWERDKGNVEVGLTEEGQATVLSADTGSSASGGGEDHRYILQESYRAFTQLSAITRRPRQEGDSLPDGLAELPIYPLDGETLTEVKELEAQLKEEHPRLYEISQGQHIAIEAETSTIKKPMQTLTNLRKALEENQKCVFTCKDATFKDGEKTGHGLGYWPDRGEKIIYDSSGGTIDYETIVCAAEVDASGDRTFYNKNAKYRLEEDKFAVRKRVETDQADQLTWQEENGELIAQTTGGKNVARFDEPEDLADPDEENIEAYREVDEEGYWVVRDGMQTHRYEDLDDLREEWQDLYTPFIPEIEFPRMPREDDFLFIVFPDDGNKKYDGPMIYEKGEMEPLFDGDESETTEKRTPQPPDRQPEGKEKSPQDGQQTSENENVEEEAEESKDNKDREDSLPKSEEEDVEKGEESDTETCPYCGRETAFKPHQVTGNMYCESCGYTPGESEGEDSRYQTGLAHEEETNENDDNPDNEDKIEENSVADEAKDDQGDIDRDLF